MLHPELEDRALLLANARRGTDCLLLTRPEQPLPARPNPYKRNYRTVVYRLTMAMMTCTVGAFSILMLANFNRAAGEPPIQPPSVLEIREFFRDIGR